MGVDFCRGRKLECLEKTLKVRLRLSETQPTYNINFVGEVEGMIDVHYTSLTSQGVQHTEMIQMVTHPDSKPVQQGLISVNRRELVFPLGDSPTACYIFGRSFLLRSRFILCSISKFSRGRRRGCWEACLRFIFCFVFS